MLAARQSLKNDQLVKAGSEVVAAAPWATMWRPAPAELVDEWRSLSRKAQASVMHALNGLRAGEPSLHLSDCELKSAGAKLVAEAMRRYPGLRNLTLSNNGIEDDGVADLAKVVGEQQGLQMLCLAFNRISDAGARALGDALQQHEGIRLLSLDDNKIGNIGAHRLVAALAQNKRTSITCSMVGNPAPKMTLRATRDLQTSAVTVREVSERGITIGQLLTFYAINKHKGTIEEAKTTSGDVAGAIILPATSKVALSYVQAGLPNNPPPTTHVIHSWSGLFRDLIYNVASHAARMETSGRILRVPDLDPDGDFWRFEPKVKKRCYFIDLFSVNQHVSMNSLRHYGLRDDRVFVPGEEGCEIDKLNLVAERIQSRGKDNKILLSVDSDQKVWARFLSLQELHTAIVTELPIDAIFRVLEPPPQGWSVVRVENSMAEDLRNREIALDEIRETIGYEAFNGLIQEWLKMQYADNLAKKIEHEQREASRGSSRYSRYSH